jgi:hypothetical protein
MPELAPPAELMRSLGKLVRGLSAIFWGLPLTLVVCVRTAMADWLRPLGIIPPLLATGLLVYGVWQLGYFQKQERVWTSTLERAKVFSIVIFGLSPFIYWWNRLPEIPSYSASISVMLLASLLFLLTLNQVLQRLAAMLPDETLRLETRLFTTLNLYLIVGVLILASVYFVVQQTGLVPFALSQLFQILHPARQWLLIVTLLLPLAMTMTMIWKIKEAILTSVFHP